MKPGALEELHWHPIESFYFVISGHATVRDIEGKEYEVGPGSFIYASPGIAGAHEWEVKEGTADHGRACHDGTQSEVPIYGRQENQEVVHRSG